MSSYASLTKKKAADSVKKPQGPRQRARKPAVSQPVYQDAFDAAHSSVRIQAQLSPGTTSGSLEHEAGRTADKGVGGLNLSDEADPMEREADRIADQIVGKPPIASGGDKSSGRLQDNGREQWAENLRIDGVGAGSPLADHLRRSLESRLGYDFSRVRVHTDRRADLLTSRVGAEAFTWKHDIVFSQNRYRPDTRPGLHQLAHELVHTA